MDKSFTMACSPEGMRRLDRAVKLSWVFGFIGISFLVPRHIKYQDFNYGQGEGQFDIGEIEIGIYYDNSGQRALVIHDFVETRRDESLALVEDFCKWWTKIAKSPVVAIPRTDSEVRNGSNSRFRLSSLATFFFGRSGGGKS